MKETISFDPIEEDYRSVVFIDKIVYLNKKNDDVVCIHLTTGEILETHDSINTLEAKINSEDI